MQPYPEIVANYATPQVNKPVIADQHIGDRKSHQSSMPVKILEYCQRA